MEPYISPFVEGLYQKRKTVSEAAEVGLLEGDKNLNMVKQYARGFGLDPDWVFNHTSFYTLTKILETDKREAEFNDRYQQMDKLLNQG